MLFLQFFGGGKSVFPCERADKWCRRRLDFQPFRQLRCCRRIKTAIWTGNHSLECASQVLWRWNRWMCCAHERRSSGCCDRNSRAQAWRVWAAPYSSGNSFLTSKQGHALAAYSLCPWTVAPGNCARSVETSSRSAFFCASVLVSFGVFPSLATPPMYAMPMLWALCPRQCAPGADGVRPGSIRPSSITT